MTKDSAVTISASAVSAPTDSTVTVSTVTISAGASVSSVGRPPYPPYPSHVRPGRQAPCGVDRIAAMSNCRRTVSLTIAPPSARREL